MPAAALRNLPAATRAGNTPSVRLFFAFFLCAAYAIFLPENAPAAQGDALTLVRIGYQKYGSLNVVKAQGTFEQNWRREALKFNGSSFRRDRNCWKA